jgi:hypothetical protein
VDQLERPNQESQYVSQIKQAYDDKRDLLILHKELSVYPAIKALCYGFALIASVSTRRPDENK